MNLGVGRIKVLVRDGLATLLYVTGAARFERWAAGQLLILTFHRVLPQDLRRHYPMPGLVATPEELRWVLSSLMPYFEVLTVSAAIDSLRERQAQRPLLAVSFDDGQWDNLRFAHPVLTELGVHATFYLPAGYIGSARLLWHDEAAFAWQRARADTQSLHALLQRFEFSADEARYACASVSKFMELLKRLPPHRRQSIIAELQAGQPGWAPPEWARLMNWTEVATLRDAGHEIGSHGCTHDLLPQLDSESRRMEVAGSMVAIERSLGVRPASFCYPNGSFDRSTIAEAEQAGYVNAVTTRWGVNRPGQSRFEFFRCDMDTRRLVDRHDRLSVARLAMRLSRYRVRGAA